MRPASCRRIGNRCGTPRPGCTSGARQTAVFTYFTGYTAAQAGTFSPEIRALVDAHADRAFAATWLFAFFASLRLAMSYIPPAAARAADRRPGDCAGRARRPGADHAARRQARLRARTWGAGGGHRRIGGPNGNSAGAAGGKSGKRGSGMRSLLIASLVVPVASFVVLAPGPAPRSPRNGRRRGRGRPTAPRTANGAATPATSPAPSTRRSIRSTQATSATWRSPGEWTSIDNFVSRSTPRRRRVVGPARRHRRLAGRGDTEPLPQQPAAPTRRACR